MGLSLFHEYSENFHHKAAVPTKPKIPKCLREYFKPGLEQEAITEIVNSIYTLTISEEDGKFVENATKKQGQSMIWKEMRVGRITASVAHDILHTNQESPSTKLILKICRISSFLNVPAVRWGQENESVALAKYEQILKNTHKDVEIHQSGLRLDKDQHILGASADAIASCSCHGSFLIEIKCPFKHKDQINLQNCTRDPAFCLNKDLKLKENHRYMTQVQMQMFVYNIKICHFVIWTNNFCSGIQVIYNEDFAKEITTLTDFHKKHIGPELVT